MTETDNQNYIRATEPHSKIGINFSTALGTVQLHYLRSAIFGLGSVFCWVDDERDKGVTIIAYWKEIYNIGRWVSHSPLFSIRYWILLGTERKPKLTNRGITIRNDLTPGDHILRCELLEATADPGGGHEFRIISVMRSVPFVSTARNVRNGAD